MTPRPALRLLAATATIALSFLSASPVLAAARDDGDKSGPGLSVVETLMLYVVAPVALFGVIALLAVAPSLAHRPRYRPGLSWWAEPVWFHGPAGPDVGDPGSPTTNGGGTSARW